MNINYQNTKQLFISKRKERDSRKNIVLIP
jgi:hypothetical protein